MAIILASKSPRRQELMQLLGVPFTVVTEDIDETMHPDKSPADEVARVSAEKARAVQDKVSDSDIVVSADTIVVLGSTIMGKPKDPEDAARMLRALSGRTHLVMTGLTVRQGARAVTETEITEITFCPLTEREIAAYVSTGEPLDKAGAYGIQGRASVFVKHLVGDYFNVMGLPVCRLAMLLRQAGVCILGECGDTCER